MLRLPTAGPRQTVGLSSEHRSKEHPTPESLSSRDRDGAVGAVRRPVTLSPPCTPHSRMKLVFVYNADSGSWNALIDTAHKLLSPSTYPCGLCVLTYDTFRENARWKSFRESAPFEMTFLHRDEFESKYGVHSPYPCILEERDTLSVLLSPDDFRGLHSVEDLIAALRSRLADSAAPSPSERSDD